VRLKWVWLAGLNIRCPLLLEKPARLASLFAVVAPKSGMSRMLRQKNCANCCAHRRKTAARLTLDSM
ncbi:hypothetical protein, partial [Pseudomonas aeruginosa]|uniref:hypothetical protein n=3 Tax=Pseudomonas aeruginosa TaxID=287 RepID=UPI001C71B87B